VILDVFHVASRQTPIIFEQRRETDGTPNPKYGKPAQYQPPMTARLGVSIGY
jgi:hypothetical protein